MHVEICACLRLLARLHYIMGDYAEVGLCTFWGVVSWAPGCVLILLAQQDEGVQAGGSGALSSQKCCLPPGPPRRSRWKPWDLLALPVHPSPTPQFRLPQQLCPAESCGARGHSGSDARALLPFTGTSKGHILTQYLVSALEAAQGLCCWLYCPGAWSCSPALLAPGFEAASGAGTLQVLHSSPAIGLLVFFSPVYASLS